MKAAIIHEFGDFEVLKYEEVPTPEPRAGHVLVKVLAAGVNRLDHYLREGTVVPELPFRTLLGPMPPATSPRSGRCGQRRGW